MNKRFFLLTLSGFIGFYALNGHATIWDNIHKTAGNFLKNAEKTAAHSNGWRIFEMGRFFYEGHGVTQDNKKAIFYWEKSAQDSDPWAENNLGLIYEHGFDVPQDFKKSLQYYRKAANQGNMEALMHLAWMTYKGQGITANQEEAIKLLNKAIEGKNIEALTRRGIIKEELNPNSDQNFIDFQKAVELGNGSAVAQLKRLLNTRQSGQAKGIMQAVNPMGLKRVAQNTISPSLTAYTASINAASGLLILSDNHNDLAKNIIKKLNPSHIKDITLFGGGLYSQAAVTILKRLSEMGNEHAEKELRKINALPLQHAALKGGILQKKSATAALKILAEAGNESAMPAHMLDE